MPVPSSSLARGEITLRTLHRDDEDAWTDLRERNRARLRPWEAVDPPGSAIQTLGFRELVRRDRRQWRNRDAFNAVIIVGGVMVGRVAITGIAWGSERSGSLGYWIDEAHGGRGLVPRASAMLARYAFGEGLHRIEIATRPENAASIRVAQKLGFRDEGLRRRFLYVDGGWRDHRIFALTTEDKRVGDVWRWVDGVG